MGLGMVELGGRNAEEIMTAEARQFAKRLRAKTGESVDIWDLDWNWDLWRVSTSGKVRCSYMLPVAHRVVRRVLYVGEQWDRATLQVRTAILERYRGKFDKLVVLK